MQPTRTYSWFPLTLLWFGAAMSVAEIQTGGITAAAGLVPGLWAVVLGHLVGVTLLGLMAYIGFREGMPTLMCTRIAFGRRGSWLLSCANIIQLLGWTAVMIQQNSQAVGGITRSLWGVDAGPVAILALGCLIGLWALWETEGKHTGNTLAVILLGLLALLVSWVLWHKAGQMGIGGMQPADLGQAGDAAQAAGITQNNGAPLAAATPGMSFGQAFELSLVMPLSWVPLVADYASRAKNARTACLAPALGYLVGSLWMYGLGFAGAMITGEANPTPMLLAAGLGVAALGVLVLSTVITTFLDVYSVTATARNIFPHLSPKKAGLCAVIIGTGAALIWDGNLYVNFLYAIGAVFAPLSAILFTDYFLLRRDERERQASWPALLSLAVGVASHAAFSALESPLGPSLSCLPVTLGVHVLLRKLTPR